MRRAIGGMFAAHDERSHMRGRLTGLVAAMAATAALAIGVGAALAATPTSVSIEAQQGGFFGYVHSPRQDPCELNRKVKLFKVKRSGDVKVGTDIAQPNGPDSMWSINTDLSGKFYAKVPATDKCDKARSDTVHSQ
jgi:hypothetical protein